MKSASTTVVAEEFVRACLPGAGRISRRRSDYATSHLIEELDVECKDGEVVHLLLKRLGSHDLLPEAKGKRPSFLVDPFREALVYESILNDHELGTARLFGSWACPIQGPWLLLERVPGIELFQVGDRTLWQEAARWLARAHLNLSRHVSKPISDRLIQYDAGFYHAWPARALRFQRGKKDALLRLTRRWEELVERLLHLPYSVIHGEFYASNVLVDPNANRLRVCPIDWEMAAMGPGLIDVAALTSGWPDDEGVAIAHAYLDELHRHGSAQNELEFDSALDDCRMFLCVQLLGWASQWAPPLQHAKDWLAEAMALAERTGW